MPRLYSTGELDSIIGTGKPSTGQLDSVIGKGPDASYQAFEKAQKKRKEDDKVKAAGDRAAKALVDLRNKSKMQAAKPWYQKGFEGVVKAFQPDQFIKNVSQGAKVSGDIAKSTFVDPIATAGQQAYGGLYAQTRRGNDTPVDKKMRDSANAETDRQLKAGEITPEKANQLRKNINDLYNKSQKAYKQTEKETGVKVNRDVAGNALVDTVTNLGGVEGLIKGGVKAGVNAVKDVAENGLKSATKNTGDKIVKALYKTEPKVPPTNGQKIIQDLHALPTPKVESPNTGDHIVQELQKTTPHTDGDAVVKQLQATERRGAVKPIKIAHGDNIVKDLKATAPKEHPLTTEAKKYDKPDEFIRKIRGSATQHSDYTPELRLNGTSKESTRISDLGIDPEKEVIIYRGVPKGNKKINVGDFVTSDHESAHAYNDGTVATMKVKAKDLITDDPHDFKSEPFYTGTELIYSPHNGKELVHHTDEELRAIHAKAHAKPEPPKPKLTKELKTAVETHLQDNYPELYHKQHVDESNFKSLVEGGGKGLPSLHVDDIKQYLGSGRMSDIPTKYKRTTGKRDIDLLARDAGYDDVDNFIDALDKRLQVRADAREAKQKLIELRRDPKVIAKAQKALADEKAQMPQVTEEPKVSKRDQAFHDKRQRAKAEGKKDSRVFDRLKNDYDLKGDTMYDTATLKSEAIKANKLIGEDKQKAYRIAMGVEQSPELTQTATNIAMFEQAVKEGNNTLASRLIQNRSLAQTRRGQELVNEKASITDNSTARYVKELLKTRMDKAGHTPLGKLSLSGGGGKVTDIIDKEAARIEKQIKYKEFDVKKAQSFIDELACK